ncbi:hypothetical protein K4L06_05680 [Lysobacter sp. BMK333-48F3]|nr:hypothetical protein [Lysobacter sp. BMK333-48F3]MBX9400795.1 hypothetical protein [Lysobacter sp. BMK333-48F3]
MAYRPSNTSLDDAPSIFFHLDAHDGILWTVGAEDILQFDGRQWERIA